MALDAGLKGWGIAILPAFTATEPRLRQLLGDLRNPVPI
jgi:hypothetical protein